MYAETLQPALAWLHRREEILDQMRERLDGSPVEIIEVVPLRMNQRTGGFHVAKAEDATYYRIRLETYRGEA